MFLQSEMLAFRIGYAKIKNPIHLKHVQMFSVNRIFGV